jgi:hypothetical protein
MNVKKPSFTKGMCFSGPLSDAPSSAVSVGGVGQRLFEFRGGLRFVQAARASFVGRPR